MTPLLLAIGIFVYGFIGWSIRVSLSNWNSFSALLSGEYTFVGLNNFKYLFEAPRFITDFWNTLFFTLFFMLGTIVLGS